VIDSNWKFLKDAQTALEKLQGLSADEIAWMLEEQGVRAVPGNAHQCAIAKYVQAATGAPHVRVSGTVQIGDSCVRVAYTPENVLAFITKFDRGDYPSLIEKVSE